MPSGAILAGKRDLTTSAVRRMPLPHTVVNYQAAAQHTTVVLIKMLKFFRYISLI